MKQFSSLNRSELLCELFAANDILLSTAKNPAASREEILAARAYLKSVVEEVERRKELELEQQAA